VLADADRTGEVTLTGPSAEMRARCAFSLIWTPENIVHALGTTGTLKFDRATLLRGAATPSSVNPW